MVNTPKLLGYFRSLAPEFKCVSFKLETDQALLEQKMTKSLKSYGFDMVIGNLLDTRYKEIFLGFRVQQEEAKDLVLVQKVEKSAQAKNIEEDMVHVLMKLFRKKKSK